jgi:nicotinate-nucleotide adenylyltransferase
MNTQKIVLFGGTFDPVHLGHITVAEAVVEKIDAEQLIFIPTKRSPLKNSFPTAGNNHRIKMLSLAISGKKLFSLSDYELKDPGPGYTIHTVRHFKNLHGPDCSICWLMGADSIDDLPRWYKITELIDECNLCTMYRAGFAKPDFTKYEKVWGAERVKKLQNNIIETPLIPISSTQIREKLAAGEDVSDMLDPAVADYIQKNKLYRSKEED